MGPIKSGDAKVIAAVMFLVTALILIIIPGVAEMPNAWEMLMRWWKYYLGAISFACIGLVLIQWSGR